MEGLENVPSVSQYIHRYIDRYIHNAHGVYLGGLATETMCEDCKIQIHTDEWMECGTGRVMCGR